MYERPVYPEGMIRLRQPLPPCTLLRPGGERVYLPDLKGKPLVLGRDEALAEALAKEALEAHAFLLAEGERPSPLPLLLDPEGTLLRAIPPGGALVADPFLEVYHLGEVAGAEEVRAWLALLEAQCPECVVPEGEWF